LSRAVIAKLERDLVRSDAGDGEGFWLSSLAEDVLPATDCQRSNYVDIGFCVLFLE